MRPTSDRVREAIFSMLGDISGAEVLDLFSGTGALAIEAVSRGAARATAVDDNTALLQANVERLGLHPRLKIVRSDAERFLRRDEGAYQLIFCDPPYTLADRLQGLLDSLIPPRLADGGRFVVESAARSPLTVTLEPAMERTYGNTRVGIYGA